MDKHEQGDLMSSYSRSAVSYRVMVVGKLLRHWFRSKRVDFSSNRYINKSVLQDQGLYIPEKDQYCFGTIHYMKIDHVCGQHV